MIFSGINELHINTATMKQIIQQWLDDLLSATTAPVVDDVAEGSHGSTPIFIITLKGQETSK